MTDNKKAKTEQSSKKDKDTVKEEKSEKPKSSQNKILAAIALIAIIAVLAVIIWGNYGPKNFDDVEAEADSDPVVAIVNSEEITQSQLDKEYRFFFFITGYPEEYLGLVSKKDFLNQTIAQMLLLQEAEKLGYDVSYEEAESELEASIQQNMITREEFEERVRQADFTMDDVIDYSAKQLALSKFIEDVVFLPVEISDAEIEGFYEENKEFLMGAELENISSLIEQELVMQKQRDMLQAAIEVIMEDADIKIFEGKLPESAEITPMATAEMALDTGSLADCISNHGLSADTVVFYHADWCPHCANMKPVVEELKESGYSFHYAETSRNEGTEVIECFRGNMESGVPQFICAGTGETAVGEMPKSELEKFAESCSS